MTAREAFGIGEEPLAERTGVLDRLKAGRKDRLILKGLELRFRVRIVVAHVGPAVALGDAEVGQEQGHRFGTHRGAAIGMQGQLSASLSQGAAMSSWASSAKLATVFSQALRES